MASTIIFLLVLIISHYWTSGNILKQIINYEAPHGKNDIRCKYFPADPEDKAEQEMARLYQLAINESRKVIVLEGGDEKDQPDGFRTSFNKKFPCLEAIMTTDLSKFHDVRIDEELKKPGEFPYDVVTLQTLHDFFNWKKDGHLLQFKPEGYDQVYEDNKDPDGFFTSTKLVSFGNYIKRGEAFIPKKLTDYLDDRMKDKLILTYPHDDDAVLFQFHLAKKEDPDFVDKLLKNNPRWVRGTATPYNEINRGKPGAIATFTTGGFLDNNFQPGDFSFPDPPNKFLTWGQLTAIFKRAPNPNTAKLWITFHLTKARQSDWSFFQWSSRRDINPSTHTKKFTDFSNTNPKEFTEFMLNRTYVDQLVKEMKDKIGEVKGESPLEDNL